jgi:hypothetical protein
MLDMQVWAVVGATKNKDKFGYRIYNRLSDVGYETYPVNPVYDEIEGATCYPSLKSLPVIPDCVDMVVGPDKAEPFIREAAELGIKRMWFQPGTFDEQTLELAESMGIQTVYYNCVLVELNKIGK